VRELPVLMYQPPPSTERFLRWLRANPREEDWYFVSVSCFLFRNEPAASSLLLVGCRLVRLTPVIQDRALGDFACSSRWISEMDRRSLLELRLTDCRKGDGAVKVVSAGI